MKYEIKTTNQFKKDLKRIYRRGYDILLFKEIVRKLSEGETLLQNNCVHNLIGNYSGYKECHISPDWLLIYEIDEGNSIVYLIRTGTHSDLF